MKIGKAGGIADAKTIVVRKVTGERFDRIVKYQLDEKPHSVTEYLDDELENDCDPFEEISEDEIPF